MLAVYIQYKYTYKKMYITDQTYSPTLRPKGAQKPLCKVLHYFWTRRQSSNPIQLELDTDWQKLPIHYQYQWIDEDWQITQFVPILSQSLTK